MVRFICPGCGKTHRVQPRAEDFRFLCACGKKVKIAGRTAEESEPARRGVSPTAVGIGGGIMAGLLVGAVAWSISRGGVQAVADSPPPAATLASPVATKPAQPAAPAFAVNDLGEDANADKLVVASEPAAAELPPVGDTDGEKSQAADEAAKDSTAPDSKTSTSGTGNTSGPRTLKSNGAKTERVSGYTTKKGTVVQPYNRSAPRK